MLEGVGEGLLHEPVHRQLHAGGHVRRLPADLERGVQPRRPDLLDERVELGEIGDRLPRLGARRVARCRGRSAQDAEEPAGIGQRRRPVADTLRMTSVARSESSADAATAASARVIMTVRWWATMSCISRAILAALGRRRERALLVSLALQPFRPVVQFGEVGAAGGEVQAEPERGGDQPGQEDRGIPPAAAREPEQDGDDDTARAGRADQRLPARPHRRPRYTGR